MTERPNVPVLKTGVGLPTVGSNPTPSAKLGPFTGPLVCDVVSFGVEEKMDNRLEVEWVLLRM